jgi:hypothetical protein
VEAEVEGKKTDRDSSTFTKDLLNRDNMRYWYLYNHTWTHELEKKYIASAEKLMQTRLVDSPVVREKYTLAVRVYLNNWRQREARRMKRLQKSFDRERAKAQLDYLGNYELAQPIEEEEEPEEDSSQKLEDFDYFFQEEDLKAEEGDFVMDVMDVMDVMPSTSSFLPPTCNFQGSFLTTFFTAYYKNQRSNIIGFPSMEGGLEYSTSHNATSAAERARRGVKLGQKVPVRISFSLCSTIQPSQVVVYSDYVKDSDNDLELVGTQPTDANNNNSSSRSIAPTHAVFKYCQKAPSSSLSSSSLPSSASASASASASLLTEYVYEAQLIPSCWPFNHSMRGSKQEGAIVLRASVYGCWPSDVNDHIVQEDQFVCLGSVRSSAFSIKTTRQLRRQMKKGVAVGTSSSSSTMAKSTEVCGVASSMSTGKQQYDEEPLLKKLKHNTEYRYL